MTTIVYKDGVLAGDSLYNANGCAVSYNKKVYNIDDTLVGFSGDASVIEFFKSWVKENCDPDLLGELCVDYSVIIVPPKGSKYYYYTHATGKTRYVCKKKDPLCLGSGSEVALGALQMGATAEEAVKASIAVDVYSGGRMYSVTH